MRIVWNLIGVACVGLGTIGWFVPGMPSTVFYIIALYGFTVGGNEKARQKLLNHKYVGSTLRHWEEHRSISRRIKWVASICIAISCSLSAWVVPVLWVKAFILGLGAFGIWYILSRKTTEDIIQPGSAVLEPITTVPEPKCDVEPFPVEETRSPIARIHESVAR
ncbi:MAG: YbaN family protein [Fimbriimonadaceae bacterium]|nr:MAG: YbaN family protein [Fimbriimonadaceae bacterium]